MFFESMHPGWQNLLADQRDLLDLLEAKVQNLCHAGGEMAPALSNVMRAFSTDPMLVRVLIVGQDPYPSEGHAIGLAFAVSVNTKPLPRSLQNMMKELATDLPACSNAGDLTRWQQQGVLLLNRHLTTSIGQAGAHADFGWANFTDAVIKALAATHREKLVALLWGNHAQSLAPMLGGATVLRAVHPSPLSAARGFFGSRPYSSANKALKKLGLETIDWSC